MTSLKRVNLELETTINSLEKSQIRTKPESSRGTRENTSQTDLNGNNLSNTKQYDPVPQKKQNSTMLVHMKNIKLKIANPKETFIS